MGWLQWLEQNAGTLVVSLLLILLLIWILRSMWKRKQRGQSCSGCGSCPMQGSCGKRKENDDIKK